MLERPFGLLASVAPTADTTNFDSLAAIAVGCDNEPDDCRSFDFFTHNRLNTMRVVMERCGCCCDSGCCGWVVHDDAGNDNGNARQD